MITVCFGVFIVLSYWQIFSHFIQDIFTSTDAISCLS